MVRFALPQFSGLSLCNSDFSKGKAAPELDGWLSFARLHPCPVSSIAGEILGVSRKKTYSTACDKAIKPISRAAGKSHNV